MNSEREPIGVLGVGWVGLVTAACFAELGHRVVAREIVPEKVAALERGELPFHEPELAELIERNRERLTFTTEIEELLDGPRLIFVCVQTPPTHSGDADLSAVNQAVREIGAAGDRALVMKSTVPVGTGRTIKRSAPDLAYVSCPEFLREGTAVRDFMEPDRVVIGVAEGDEWAADEVEAVYEPLGAPVVRTDLASAEMIKLASNAFLATKISFINEIANVSEEVGADVTEVARGMGLDDRIGPKFLRAGIGYGGSCFSGTESVMVRLRGNTRLLSFSELWAAVDGDELAVDGEAFSPPELEVWSWVPGEPTPKWMPVALLTKREYDGAMIEVRTKMGRRIRVTDDHPFVVGDGKGDRLLTRVLAKELSLSDWLPLALGAQDAIEIELSSVVSAIEDRHVDPKRVVVRPERREIEALAELPSAERAAVLEHPRPSNRMGHIKRSGTLRLQEACNAEMDLQGARLGTAGNGTFNPPALTLDEAFWRVVGLYLAEGCIGTDRRFDPPRDRIIWSFHPHKEQHLVDEVTAYWQSQDVEARTYRGPTSQRVEVSSRIIGAWWAEGLGLGRTSYDQRIPDLLWQQGVDKKRAALAGLWEGDGSWSLVNGGPSVILEWGTVSDELADGVARLLGELGLVCSWRRGRTRKSTKETHWLRVSGAEQIERGLFLVPEAERRTVRGAIAAQKKRIAPTGYRRFGGGLGWLRVTETKRLEATGPVYSMKVPGSQTVVSSGGLVCHQCFPKDVSALKILAGNSGYHFQLLSSVIEVNELQKRKVISKLSRNLGSLTGKRVAILGLAFKPDTDDMREATSLVLAARLLGEGAQVVAYDPIARDDAAELLPGVEMADAAEVALEGADAAVLVTEWPEFAELNWEKAATSMNSAVLVDGRNFLDSAAMREAGFVYEGIGRESAAPGGQEG